MLKSSRDAGDETPGAERRPKEWKLRRARPFDGDLRSLPRTRPSQVERPEREAPIPNPRLFVPSGITAPEESETPIAPINGPSAPAPAPSISFEGMSYNINGDGHPPDTNGDVGPNHYIQTINTSIGIYDKATGNEITHFSFDTFMSQGQFGNLCDTNNFGDPVVLYDTFEDRWIITDFAFSLDGSNNVINPPGAFQCFAVSKSSDPVSGGWNYYSINTAGGLGDYPKFGIWPDGLYMSVNMFGYSASATFQNPRVYAFNKAQMYAGAPSVQSVSFDAPSADFTILPSNARLQTGTPPAGTPNYFLSTWELINAVTVYKFHVDWNKISTSTFTGPDTPVAATSWPNASVPNAPSLGGNSLDVLQIRAMMQNQYSNRAGIESLWATHTVRRGDTNGFAAPRFYQVPVTGGTVGANITQAATFDPDAANVMYRFMPSVAVDRAGNMALGYSTSSSTTKPAIKYAGRLATDPINTFSQTEQVLIQGAGTQTGSCGGTCTRWGDYSAMTLDPDGCRFWYTNMYYQVDGLDHHTRIASFSLPQCTTVGSGSAQGTVTSSSGGGPINGATVVLGSRTTTTDASGFYSFQNLPAGTYPSISASFAGYGSSTVNNVVVTTGSITAQNFILGLGSNNGCFSDTLQADFQTGVPTSVDLISSPGNATLLNAANVDQQNQSVTTNGFGFTSTSWAAQTFTPAVTGQLTRADLDLFCSSCTGTTPNITVSIRATSSDLPTGADLATATISGFSSASGGFFAANFASPPTLTAGTRYAIVIRAVSNPSAGTYAYVVSSGSVYANGRRALSSSSGASWSAGAPSNDLGFITYMKSGFALSGNLISSLKDANPHAGGAVTWTTLSWTATTPAGTVVKFQVAGSNNANGPFTFVGPNGTAATFFTTTGASLAQFNGLRYLKYEAILTTNSGAVTPTLNDVTVCFTNTVPTSLAVSSASGTYGGTVNLSATLTDGVSPLSGRTINFSLNGNSAGSAVTNASGVASLSNVSLTGISGGTYPTGVGASFTGVAPFNSSSGSNSLTVNKAGQTISFGALADKTFGDPDFNVSATASSGLSVSFGATGQCTVTGNTVHLTSSGSCTITASQAGDTNYNAAPNVPQAFNIASNSSTNSATFVNLDTVTQGNWKGVYGADGYNVVNDTVNYPAYAQVNLSNQSPYTWVGSTSDTRALQKAATSDRLAATWYAPASFDIDVNITDGQTHGISLYCLDWDTGNSRIQTIQVLDAGTEAVLDSRNLSSFSNGKYLFWNISGHVKLRVTRTTGPNAVVSGLFFQPTSTPTPTPTPNPGSASFVNLDGSTQGTWHGIYGADGYNVVNDTANYPSYAQVTPSSQSSYTWAGSTSDVRALQKGVGSDRIAATWYAPSTFDIDVNISDGQTHQIALYCLDWDATGRVQTIDVRDAATDALLDSRNVSSFSNGQYAVWNISGRVKFRVTKTAGVNAVVAGLMFQPTSTPLPSPTPTPSPNPGGATFINVDTTTRGTWKGVYGVDGYNVVNDTVNYPGYAQVSVSDPGSYTWASSTADVRALQRAVGSDRIAATWHTTSSFDIDVNISDGQTHQFALYCLDWDTTSRVQTIEVFDAATHALLDSRNVSSFNNGQYVVWNISGHVKFSVSRTAGLNAVVSGVFFH